MIEVEWGLRGYYDASECQEGGYLARRACRLRLSPMFAAVSIVAQCARVLLVNAGAFDGVGAIKR